MNNGGKKPPLLPINLINQLPEISPFHPTGD